MKDFQALLSCINYQPDNKALFEQALTHRSFGRDNNERLEFIGDALLDLVIGASLFERFPDLAEGELSHLRSILVKGDTLAIIGLEIGLDKYIRLGLGEKKSGGAKRPSIIADAFEAFIGAIYLDGGFEASKAWVLSLFESRLAAINPNVNTKDAKTQLQEFLQAKKHPLPSYHLTKTQGKQHQQIFTIACRVEGEDPVEATGTSKKLAEQNAAYAMMQKLHAFKR
ncbi:MAG: ribonuclease III [Cellvibrionales bacterium]|nr:ribonuclease III [Cellvibrionales bacterium]